MYVFLDLETTGLDPVNDHILEIAMVVTDDKLEIIGEPFRRDVLLTAEAAGRLYTNPFVRDMHRKTGLLDRLEALIVNPRCDADLTEVEIAAVDHLYQPYAPGERPPKLTIAGNSVHFDLAFLRHHMPDLAHMFSHRIMDVSVLRMFEDRHGSGKIDVPNDVEHSALSDVLCSIRQLHAYIARRRLAPVGVS